MKRAAIFTAVLLLGSAFVFAGAASAEDVNRCESAGPAYACVEDSTRGDKAACEGYRGATGAEAGVNDDAGNNVNADAQGRETCFTNPFTGEQRSTEEVTADTYVCLQAQGSGGFFNPCEVYVANNLDWGQQELSASSFSCATPDGDFSCEGGYDASFEWGQGQFDDECGTDAGVSILGTDQGESVEEDCPAGSPPGSPNPGWGQVTPDVPDMLEEQLPE